MCNDLRDIYEAYTKKIRFNCYKKFDKHPIVILGHNKDDCFENILTNIAYNSKYDNLKGIEEYCKTIEKYNPFIYIETVTINPCDQCKRGNWIKEKKEEAR